MQASQKRHEDVWNSITRDNNQPDYCRRTDVGKVIKPDVGKLVL